MLKIASKTMSKKGVKYKRKTNEFFFFLSLSSLEVGVGWIDKCCLFTLAINVFMSSIKRLNY